MWALFSLYLGVAGSAHAIKEPRRFNIAAHGGFAFHPGTDHNAQGYGFDAILRYDRGTWWGAEVARLGWAGFESITQDTSDNTIRIFSSQTILLGSAARVFAPEQFRQKAWGFAPWASLGPTLQITIEGKGSVLRQDNNLRAGQTDQRVLAGLAADIALGFDWFVDENVALAVESRMGMPLTPNAQWIGFVGAFVSYRLAN